MIFSSIYMVVELIYCQQSSPASLTFPAAEDEEQEAGQAPSCLGWVLAQALSHKDAGPWLPSQPGLFRWLISPTTCLLASASRPQFGEQQ